MPARFDLEGGGWRIWGKATVCKRGKRLFWGEHWQDMGGQTGGIIRGGRKFNAGKGGYM